MGTVITEHRGYKKVKEQQTKGIIGIKVKKRIVHKKKEYVHNWINFC